ncbi:cell wall-binding repeat-containing protein [Desulfitobacterium sp. Sab5]|uniref:cell wall-binding repeat-containing protein n=1 Tax=Desulfitobacterium nosdiversum TaxID=3375356 RepID=UPI003CEC9544
MRKTKKALASLAIAGMVLSIAPMSVFGATDVTRLSDADRVGTAIAIAANGWTSTDSVIVVPADDANIVDALAAAPLAGQLNAPILVTYKGALDPKVQQEIVDLKAKNVYAVGALSADTVAALKAISGVNVTALQGADRTETAAKVAAQLTNIKGSFVVAYNGVADAMSAASYAAANGYSILVENPDATLPANEAAYKGATQYTVGGQAKLDGATALAGADRYATNDAVVNALDYKYDKVYVANGETLVDALAGASLAAKTNSPIVLADTTKAATGVNGKVTDSTQVIALGGVGAVPEAVRASVGKTTPSGPVSVQSVKASAANQIKVTFGAAPADTSKVTFDVQRSTTPVTVTATWNDAKTEATLTGSANFPEGSYTVAVKNDTTDLGTSTLDITAQKVAKINITSTKLAVTTTGAAVQTGYATYQVEDQYGNDITTASLANSLNFQSGVSNNMEWKDGLITIHPGSLNLLQFSTVVITGYDDNTGVSTTATLTVSTQVGSLSSFKLTTLTNADGKELSAGDSSSVFYAGYEAVDISGNKTTNLDLIRGGLITNTNNNLAYGLTTSSSYVTAEVVEDPSDSTKAAIEVKVAPNVSISMDMPITITAMTWTGSTSSINVTLKKGSVVDKFTLMAPAYDIAQNETKEIPFVAYDQNGVQLTDASDISMDDVTFSSNITTKVNVDGTLSLWFTSANTGSQVITAMTSSGKYSSVTINVEDPAYADTLALDSTKLVNNMEAGAVQKVDFGFDKGGLSVKDQYGRLFDMSDNANGYQVKVESSDTAVVNYVSGHQYAYEGQQIQLQAGATTGTATVKFTLIKTSDGTVKDTKSVTIANVSTDDIKGYTIDSVANAIYTSEDNANTITDFEKAYAANPKVYGQTAGGAKVALAGNPVIGAYVDSTDFAVTAATTSSALAYDAVKVTAHQLDTGVTSSSTNLTVTIQDQVDQSINVVTTAIKSTNAAPVAKDLAVQVKTWLPGVTVNSIGDEITISTSAAAANGGTLLTANTGLGNGATLARYDVTTGASANRAAVNFYTLDQYGVKGGIQLAQILKTGDTLTNGSFTVDANGLISASLTTATRGTVTLKAISTNGLVKTIKITFAQ